jgi:hypothetical protein
VFKFLAEEVAAVGAIVTELLYFVISGALVAAVGQVLSRSGRAFLSDLADAARPASRLLVVTFYLLSMGFVALTAPSWSQATSPARAAGLLTGKLGVLLLVLGVLHVASTVVFARLRRGRLPSAPSRPGGASPSAGLSGGLSGGPSAGPSGGPDAGDSAGTAGRIRDAATAPALWRAGRVVH